MKYVLGELRVTTRSSPRSSTWSMSGGVDEQVAIKPASNVMDNSRKAHSPCARLALLMFSCAASLAFRQGLRLPKTRPNCSVV